MRTPKNHGHMSTDRPSTTTAFASLSPCCSCLSSCFIPYTRFCSFIRCATQSVSWRIVHSRFGIARSYKQSIAQCRDHPPAFYYRNKSLLKHFHILNSQQQQQHFHSSDTATPRSRPSHRLARLHRLPTPPLVPFSPRSITHTHFHFLNLQRHVPPRFPTTPLPLPLHLLLLPLTPPLTRHDPPARAGPRA